MSKLMKLKKIYNWGRFEYEAYDEGPDAWVSVFNLSKVLIGDKEYDVIKTEHSEKVSDGDHVFGNTSSYTVKSTVYKIDLDGRIVDLMWAARQIIKAPVFVKVSS